MRRLAVDIGLLPNRGTASDAAALAALAEERGLDGAWAADSPGVFRDPFVTLAVCAQQTSSLTLGTAVTNPVIRDPVVLAGACATLAELSEGRFVLGIGVGESAVYNAGLRPATLARLEHAITAVRSLIAHGAATFEGRRLRMGYASPPVSIFVGASGPRTLELAGRLADGVIFQVGASASAIEYALDRIRAGAESAGRSPADIELCIRLALSLDEDRTRARDEMKAYAGIAANTIARTVPAGALPEGVAEDLRRLRDAYDYAQHGDTMASHQELITDSVLDAVAISGTVDEALARMRPIVDLGVHRFIIPLNVTDRRGLVETLANQLAPALRKAVSM